MSFMNPSLFKLRVSQAVCPIHTGQVLPVLKKNLLDKLRSNQEDSLNNANFVKVDKVSRLQKFSSREGKSDTYHLAVTPVIWDKAEMEWLPQQKQADHVSPHPFDVTMSEKDMYEAFGVLCQNTTNKSKQGAITKVISDIFRRAGKSKEFIEKYSNMDFDYSIRELALKDLTKVDASPEQRADIFRNTLLSLQEDSLEIPEDNTLEFVWGAFTNNLREEINSFEKNPEGYARKVKKDPEEEKALDYLSSTPTEKEEQDTEVTAEKQETKMAERVPVGGVIKIKRKPLPDFEELTRNVVQDPERSGSQATEDIETYLREITSADDLIENDGKLIALKIFNKE